MSYINRANMNQTVNPYNISNTYTNSNNILNSNDCNDDGSNLYKTFSKESNSYNFKVIMLGDIAVGKTSIMNRFVENEFKSNYNCTVGVEYKIKSLHIDQNTTVELKIWDTCGEEKYRTITRQYYRDTHGVVLVFDLTNKYSLDKLNGWLKDIKDTADNDISVILVGNKLDVKERKLYLSEEAKKFAMKNNMPYIEVSAKLGRNITKMFENITKKMIIKEIENIKIKNENSYADQYIVNGRSDSPLRSNKGSICLNGKKIGDKMIKDKESKTSSCC